MNKRSNAREVVALRQCFADGWRGLGARHVPKLDGILASYSEPNRVYHTLEHVLDCLRWLAVTEALAERPLEVRLALVYHDVVYDPSKSDNEKCSAELFRAHARASHLPNGPCERIVGLIEGTALHCTSDGDGALLNDIDLAVLGSSPHQFARYEAQIRKEYGHVDDVVFWVGREVILKSFLDAPSIYRTAFFRQRFETQARTNLWRARQSRAGPTFTRLLWSPWQPDVPEQG